MVSFTRKVISSVKIEFLENSKSQSGIQSRDFLVSRTGLQNVAEPGPVYCTCMVTFLRVTATHHHQQWTEYV